MGEIRVTKHKIGTVMVKISAKRQKLGEIRVKSTRCVWNGGKRSEEFKLG